MKDKLGNILLKPSPLKKKGAGGSKDKKRNEGKYAGMEMMGEMADKMDGLGEDLNDIQVDNPFANAQNAYNGLPNQYADMDNVYQGAKNVYKDKMKNAFEGQENAFEGMKNQYEDMENAYEDLKVNTQQAEFESQQNAQHQANIMGQLRGASGTSGVAALAQTMANQGALQAAKASASIGAQEGANAKLMAEAGQKIKMAVAGEGSKIAMAQAGEQARLQTQERKAEMDIQSKVLGADEALQAQKLGEQSKLNMAEAKGASDLQMAAAQGQMSVQELQGKGYMWEREQELGKVKTQMEATMGMMSAGAAMGSAPRDKGFWGMGGKSDIRLKENIIKTGYSKSGIPIYNFNYIGDDTPWSGTMAQDLLKIGRKDAVTKASDGYYRVNYDIIDVNMKALKSSPLKQLAIGNTAKPDAKVLQEAQKAQGELKAGMYLLSEDQRRKHWDSLQVIIEYSRPVTEIIRREKDKILRKNQRALLGDQGVNNTSTLPNENTLLDAMFVQIKEWQAKLVYALENDDKGIEKEIKIKLASLKRMQVKFREAVDEFYKDHFQENSYLSKGVSQQEMSYATQIYCENTELYITHADRLDVARGQLDCFGELVVEGTYYAAVPNFKGEVVLVNLLQANRNQFWINPLKIMQYGQFLIQVKEKATEARMAKSVVNPPVEKMNYEIDSILGLNDGTATIKQDQCVISYAWDEDLTQDGNSFRRHLYEHPEIQNLNYGGFDWDNMKFNLPLGPGDTNHWADEIDDQDRLLFVDAICNVDNPFFDIKLLRTLVKEYVTHKIENVWWKAMGYEEGKLEVMRFKAMELRTQRFAIEEANAAKSGLKSFRFDGETFKTSKKLLKAQAEKDKDLEDIMMGRKQPPPEPATGGTPAPTTPQPPQTPNA